MSPLTVHLHIDHNIFLSKLYFQATRASFVVVLFLFLTSLHLQECGTEKGINFFFKREAQGYRLTGSLLASLNAFSAVECAYHCSINNCCRAVNYKERGPNENCELLHILVTDHRGFLKEDENYDYFVLLQPNRGNCFCTVDQENKTRCTAQTILTIHIRSEGVQDPGIQDFGYASIQLNGVEKAKRQRGYNVVVVNGDTGAVESSKVFDTWLNDHAPLDLIDHLNSIQARKLVLIAIQDEGSRKMTNAAYDALRRFGATNQLRNNTANSYALLGYSGPGELDAVTQVQWTSGKGPSIISKVISLPLYY